MGELMRIRVKVKDGYWGAGKRGVIFSRPEPGEQMAMVLMDGADAPEMWAWRVLDILGPDTRKPAGRERGEEGAGPLDCYGRPVAVQLAEGCKCFADGQILMTGDCPVHGEAEEEDLASGSPQRSASSPIRDAVEYLRSIRSETSADAGIGLEYVEQALQDESFGEFCVRKALALLGEAPPKAEQSAQDLDTELRRWQDAIHDLLVRCSGKTDLDGSGSDSGDPLDFTLTEIEMAFNHLDDVTRELPPGATVQPQAETRTIGEILADAFARDPKAARDALYAMGGREAPQPPHKGGNQ